MHRTKLEIVGCRITLSFGLCRRCVWLHRTRPHTKQLAVRHVFRYRRRKTMLWPAAICSTPTHQLYDICEYGFRSYGLQCRAARPFVGLRPSDDRSAGTNHWAEEQHSRLYAPHRSRPSVTIRRRVVLIVVVVVAIVRIIPSPNKSATHLSV